MSFEEAKLREAMKQVSDASRVSVAEYREAAASIRRCGASIQEFAQSLAQLRRRKQ